MARSAIDKRLGMPRITRSELATIRKGGDAHRSKRTLTPGDETGGGLPSSPVLPPTPGVAREAGGRLLAWVPGRLTNPLNGSHKHWAVKARDRKGWREVTALCVGSAMRIANWGYAPFFPKVVILTAFTWNTYDDDGLAAALKPVVDGLRDARLIHSDDPQSGHRIERRQVIDRKHRGVEVVVEPRHEIITP